MVVHILMDGGWDFGSFGNQFLYETPRSLDASVGACRLPCGSTLPIPCVCWRGMISPTFVPLLIYLFAIIFREVFLENQRLHTNGKLLVLTMRQPNTLLRRAQ